MTTRSFLAIKFIPRQMVNQEKKWRVWRLWRGDKIVTPCVPHYHKDSEVIFKLVILKSSKNHVTLSNLYFSIFTLCLLTNINYCFIQKWRDTTPSSINLTNLHIGNTKCVNNMHLKFSSYTWLNKLSSMPPSLLIIAYCT